MGKSTDAGSPRDDLEAVDKELRRHPGARAVRRIKNVRRVYDVWQGFAQPMDQLLASCETDEEAIVALTRNVGDRTAGEQLTRLLDQSLLAYVAGLVAVVDQSRPIVDLLSPANQKAAATRGAALLAAHPEAVFLAKLRNYVLHYLAAPWQFTATFGEGQALRGEISLESEQLLEYDGWSTAKSYIRSAGPSIHIRPLIRPHFLATAEHTNWLLNTAWHDCASEIEQANLLIMKRNLILTGGATDGHDWEARVAHMQENIRRKDAGEPQTDFNTGLPISE
ncbi:hypothetical protein [Microbacterium hominis]|nr:hypothetical protein [Microbacterium hominis]